MFTPPPSPLPPPPIPITNESDSHSTSEKGDSSGTSLLDPSSCKSEGKRMQEAQMAAVDVIIQTYERKRRTARRIRWAVLLVPAVLILVAFTSRRVTSLGILDDPESVLGLDVDGVRVGDELLSGLWSGSMLQQEETSQSNQDQILHHNNKRQVLSLSNPAAPSETDLITSGASDPSELPASETDSPTSTVPPQTEQTIPPVPDPSDPPTIPTPFPQPFDSTGPTSNLTTQTCANFFINMTQELPFRSCRPFSLLEYFSSEFIEQAQTNLTLLNELIFGTCNTNTPLDACVSNMDWFASKLESDCATELRQNNQRVRQTLLALQSYSLLRAAACLVNQPANTYCYSVAAHASSPADIFLYQLPLGIGFPVSTTEPSCSPCSRSILGLYADAVKSGNETANGLRDTYEDAASQAEEACGSGFATVGIVTSGELGLRLAWRGWGWGWGSVMSVSVGMVVNVGMWL